MMHGPCGTSNMQSPCMVNGQCSKFYPRSYSEFTYLDEQGYPKYRRRNTSIKVTKKDIDTDNQFVIPYNAKLLKRFQAHINIEWCNQTRAIKYLFKYINKGPNHVTCRLGLNDTGNV